MFCDVCVFQVLVSVRSQIEQYTTSRPDFTEMIREAAQYLLLKDQIIQERGLSRHHRSNISKYVFVKLCLKMSVLNNRSAYNKQMILELYFLNHFAGDCVVFHVCKCFLCFCCCGWIRARRSPAGE